MAEYPVFSEIPLAHFHELLKFEIVLVVTEVESERHRRIYLCEVNLLRYTFVELKVSFHNHSLIALDSFVSGVRIKKDQTFVLHSNEIKGFSRPASNNTDVEILHEESADCWKVLMGHFLQSKTY